MIKAVLFDYGGVLSPGGKSLAHVYSELLGVPEEQVNLKPLHNELRCGLISTEDFFTKLGQRYGKTLSVQRFMELSDIYQKAPAVYDVAERLRQHGVKTGILSNMYKMSADKLSREGYYDGFDPILLSCNEKMAKPTPAFYALAIERTGCQPEEIVFIDDQEKLLLPAVAFGMKVIKSVTPDQVVKDLTDLLQQENGIDL